MIYYNPFENVGDSIDDGTKTKTKVKAEDIDLANSPTDIITTQGDTPVLVNSSGYVPDQPPDRTPDTDITGALAKYGEAEALFENPFLMDTVSDMAMPTAFSTPLEYSSFRGGQEDLIKLLRDRAEGKGPSVAQEMLKAQNDRMINQQMALAASQSGRGMPATQRQLMQQAAMGNQQLGQNLAIMRAQEMLANAGLLGKTLTDSRAGDQGFENLKLRQGEGIAGVDKVNMLKNLDVSKANLNSKNLNRQGLVDAIMAGGDLMGNVELAELDYDINKREGDDKANSPLEWLKVLGGFV